MNRTDQPYSGEDALASARLSKTCTTITFEGFRLEPDGSLFRDGKLVHLTPRELAALRLLLASGGKVVTPTELKRALWGDTNVTADSVPKCLSSLRTRLQPVDCIQTVYKRGYRLLADVKHLEPALGTGLPRLAIAPFVADSGVPEHLGTALSEEIIFRLSNARTPRASILARDSVFNLAARGLTAQQIGESLNADLVLAGTIRTLAARFRLRVEMIRVSDGVQIWVEDLLVDRDRLAGLESDLTGRLDFRLRQWPADFASATVPTSPNSGFLARLVDNTFDAHIHASDRSIQGPTGSVDGSIEGSWDASKQWHPAPLHLSVPSLPSRTTSTSEQRREAHELYLRGHHEWQTLERHRMQDGQQLLMRAIELDPHLVAAKVDLVQLCSTQVFYGYIPPATAAEIVRRTADSIVDFPRTAHAILPDVAWVQLSFDRNLAAALWSIELSSLLRHDVWVTRVRTMFALSRHRFADAIEQVNAAIQLDPFSPWLHNRLAWALHLDGQAAASVAAIEHSIRLFPEHEATSLYGSMILAFNGDSRRSIALSEKLLQRQPYYDAGQPVHAYALACAGRDAEARTILERLQWLSRERFVIGSYTPAVLVALGDLDAAIDQLVVCNETRDPWFLQVLGDPRLKPLHGQAKFEELRAIIPAMEAAAQA